MHSASACLSLRRRVSCDDILGVLPLSEESSITTMILIWGCWKVLKCFMTHFQSESNFFVYSIFTCLLTILPASLSKKFEGQLWWSRKAMLVFAVLDFR